MIERIEKRNRNRSYFLDSGRLAQLKVKKEALDQYRPLEFPTLVNQSKSFADPFEGLVYIESPENTFPILYRPLFSKQRMELPKEAVDSLTYVDGPEDISKCDLFRYLTCRIARQSLPSAGRVLTIDGDRIVVSIGKEGGVSPGDTMRLLRYFDEGYQNVVIDPRGRETERMLPIRLKVTEVFDHHCTMVVMRSGFEDVWPHDYLLKEGDIVIPARQDPIAIGILSRALIFPNPRSKIASEIRRDKTGKVGERALVNTAQLSSNFLGEITEALTKLDIPTNSAENLTTTTDQTRFYKDKENLKEVLKQQVGALRNARATHVFGASFQPLNINNEEGSTYDIRMGIFPLTPDSEKKFEKLEDSINFRMDDRQLPE